MTPNDATSAATSPSSWRDLPPEARGGHRVAVPKTASFRRKYWAFAGPGFIVAVGYMDPGNWATDIAGGSAHGYLLLSVVLISSLMAMVLQAVSARLGIATGHDLAQLCRRELPRALSLPLWGLAEIGIIACDLAEIIGTAIALKLLFGIPLEIGVLMTVADVMLILYLQQRGVRWLEASIAGLILVIGICFAYQIALSGPNWSNLFAGFVPRAEVVRNPDALLIAIGIIGATVMPHNLYLHSAILRSRAIEPTESGKREAIRFATIDSTLALSLALLVNAAILIVAASTFHASGRTDVAEIEQAHALLAPLLGASLASVAFAFALLASGHNASITATLAGQVVMEGFVNLRMRPWARRLLTRALAIGPAVAAVISFGDQGTTKLLVLSQVVLSLQLPFAMVPLIWFAGRRELMGPFVIGPRLKLVVGLMAAIIIALNLLLLRDFFMGGGS